MGVKICYNNYCMLKRTPLFQEHLKLNAKIAPFAGFEMPVSYSGIIAEHNAVRSSVGIFDIGHMGLVKIVGDNALAFLQKVATNDASKLALGQCQYSILCNEQGGVVDDILVYSLPMYFLLVVNASNIDKVLAWLKDKARDFKDVSIGLFDNYCMLSIQGPKAEEVVSRVLDVETKDIKRNHTLWWRDIIISRTGYTGENGLELIVAKNKAVATWQAFINAGVKPCGLGARDTLRLEAGYPLYGHEYDDKTTPIEAGYGWAIKFDKGDFIGREALLKQKEAGIKKKLVGLELEGRAIPRHGQLVTCSTSTSLGATLSLSKGSQQIGQVTSGTFSPTLKKPLALAYLTEQASEVFVTIRGNKVPAKVVAKTFYKR